MRLSKNKINTLKISIRNLRPNSKIYLFGSRVYNDKKGGDIDILILDKKKLSFIDKGKIERDFFTNHGEQKLDLVSFENSSTETFKELILEEAIAL